MRLLNPFVVVLNVLLFFSIQRACACGYDWVGDCSSAVHLRINGTLDSFLIADCPSGIRFQGLYLGTLQNLSLANARAITWESCINNVTNVQLKYRLYEQGSGAGNFQTLSLDQDYFTLLGPYTTRYRSKASNIDLTNGLVVGKTYVLETYFLAEIDTIGDDFIPETTIVKNNGGQNYRLSFTYGGPSAAPFVVIPTHVKAPNCHGESNGTAGVSVWGDHTGLFYNWSNIPLNFYEQNSLPAGTYTVTVTGANYAESNTIVLQDPSALTMQTSNLQPVSCGGGVGQVTVLPEGGTPPYRYTWQNGQTTATATFISSGSYAVSVIDDHNCILVQNVNIPGGGLIEQNQTTSICPGQSIHVGSVEISAAGAYNIVLPATTGCDTLLHLNVLMANPAALLANLPANILLTCTQMSINLCAENDPEAQYQWSKDGLLATQTQCLLATAGGVYVITVTLSGCTSSKNIVSEEHAVPQPASFAGKDTLTCIGFDATPTLFVALTNATNPSFTWSSNGQFLSANDSCWFAISSGGFNYALPDLLVTDAYGCQTMAEGILSIKSDTNVPAIFLSFENATGTNIPDGSAMVDVSGPANFQMLWSTGQTDASIQGLLPGTYCVTVTGSNHCESSECVVISAESGVHDAKEETLKVSPNPAQAGTALVISIPEDINMGATRVLLRDAQGIILLSLPYNEPTKTMVLGLPASMTPGIYFLQVLGSDMAASAKIYINK